MRSAEFIKPNYFRIISPFAFLFWEFDSLQSEMDLNRSEKSIDKERCTTICM